MMVDQRRFVRQVFALLVSVAALTGCDSSKKANTKEAANARDKVIFEGTWDGKFEDHKGDKGTGKYVFHKEKDGQFDVTVSWANDTKQMDLKGERLGLDAIRLEGEYTGTRYWYIGRMVDTDTTMVLPYLSVEGKTGPSGSGVSTLTRRKK